MTEQPSHAPSSLIVTFYGAYGRPVWEGCVPVAELVRLMGALDVDPPSVRSAVSRLKRRGLLVPERVAGAAAYALSPDARQVLEDGDRRIYGLPRHSPGGDWVLAVFSVPESERHKRHLLRSRLGRLGFGTAAPGVWIAPAHLEDEARHALRRLGLDPYVDLFGGAHLGFEPTAAAVRRWWDLDGVAALYEEFLEVYEPLWTSWSTRSDTPADEAFRDYLRTLDAWRRLPYADPRLPPALLPAGWPGERAEQVFRLLHERLREAGAELVRRTGA